MTAVTVPTKSKGAPIRWSAIALATLGSILATNLVGFVRGVGPILRYPYDLDYGEGIVWQQMLNIVAGHGYAPIGVYPAIVYHYPPIYHLTVAAVAALFGGDPLEAGRSVSLVATGLASILVGLIAAQSLSRLADTRTATIGGILAGLIFASCGPVIEWATTMRVDMLACLFSFAGLALTFGALRRPHLICAAALAFVLAVFTKQVSIAAPAAAMLGLFVTRPRLGIMLLVACVAMGLVALAGLAIQTHGGFLRHIILYNINRNDLSRLRLLTAPTRDHVALLLLACTGARTVIMRLRQEKDIEIRAILLILTLYLGFKSLMLLMMAKSGSATNYMVEWFAPVAVFAAIGMAPAIRDMIGGSSRSCSRIVIALMFVAAAQAAILGAWDDVSEAAAGKAARLDRLVAAIRRSDAPVISDDMTLLIRAGQPVRWEPSIAAELASVGRYDERRFAAMIRHHCFAGFVTDGVRGDRVFDSRYNPAVADAMDTAYPRLLPYARLTLHLPSHGTSVHPCPAA